MINTLSPGGFQRARKFLLETGRPLEKALFAFHFQDQDQNVVIDALGEFRNQDGGFGQALEPDVRTPSSSALATGIGLAYLVEAECNVDNPLVQGAVAYLLSTFDDRELVWRVVPPDANHHPHAPWWHDEEGSLKETFDGIRIIPRVLILAGLHHYASLVPGDWLDAITERTVSYIVGVEVLGQGGGSDLEYAIALAAAENLPGPYGKRLRKRIRAAISEVVVQDPDQWDTYCIKPLGVAPAPDALGADLIREALDQHLDYVIGRQTPAGCWNPTWSLGRRLSSRLGSGKTRLAGHPDFGEVAQSQSL